MTQVNFGSTGAAHKPGVYPGIHEVGADNYIAALLNESVVQSDSFNSSHGAQDKKGGNRLIQLAVAGIAGVLAWRMGLGKAIAARLGNLKPGNIPSWFTGFFSRIFKKTPNAGKQTVGEQMDLPFGK